MVENIKEFDVDKLKASIVPKEEEEAELKEIEVSFRKSTISKFKKLLAFSVLAEVTDIILAAGHHYYWRSGKTLQPGSTDIWTPKELEVIANFLVTGDPMSQIGYNEVFLSAETSYQLTLPSLFSLPYDEGGSEYDEEKSDESEVNNLTEDSNLHVYEEKQPQRFRVSIFKEKGNFRIILRLIPTEMRSLKELNLPLPLETIANLLRGLILITGATGQGKSTTISALLEYINQNRVCHIITLEDPIEFIYKSKKALISQREVAADNRYFYDVKDYPTGIREALRQSPDVIMIGEIRDAATFEAVLTAAESGHLVISAIHTSDVMATLEKIMSYYPEREGKTILSRLSRSLKAIVSQRLLPANLAKTDTERIPAVEIMRVIEGMGECFRTHEKINDIPNRMATGKDPYGMQTFDQHLVELVKQDLISIDTAMSYATSEGEVQTQLTKLGKFM